MSDNPSNTVMRDNDYIPEVSVIIPVYNVENYLAQCLDSVVNQTLKDIEIICIDDGSTDNSLKVLEEYAKGDSRIQIITQSNKGSGATRNVGMGIASGKYIYFIDSDDFINSDTLKIAYSACEEKSLDFVMFQLINYDDETGEYFTDEYFNMTKFAEETGDSVFNYRDHVDLFFSLSVTAYNKLYNRQFLLKHNIQFSEGLIFEDNVFYYKSILLAERVSFIKKHLYNRRIRQGSIITSNNKKHFDVIKATDLVFDLFKDLGLYDEFEQRLLNYKVSNIFVWYSGIDLKYKEEFYLKIKNHFRALEKSPEARDNYISKLFNNNKILLKNFMDSDTVEEFDMLLEIEELKVTKISLNKNVGLLRNENKSLKEINFDLNEKNKVLNNANKDLRQFKEAVLNSYSWKITAVFRKITSFFKKIKV